MAFLRNKIMINLEFTYKSVKVQFAHFEALTLVSQPTKKNTKTLSDQILFAETALRSAELPVSRRRIQRRFRHVRQRCFYENSILQRITCRGQNTQKTTR